VTKQFRPRLTLLPPDLKLTALAVKGMVWTNLAQVSDEVSAVSFRRTASQISNYVSQVKLRQNHLSG